MSSASRRRALADFLRSRRDRLTPAEVGLPAGPRRRAPGLRREELAQLAGVSVTWYTWLEQARDITVSRQVLASLARELRLTETERQHLFALAEEPPDGPPESSPRLLRAMVDALDPNPAYVLDAHWDFVAWNRAEAALIGDPAQLPDAERNLLWLVFTVPRIRTLLVDWPGQARNLLAQYRADAANRAEDTRADELVRALREASPEFGEWWAAHDVAPFTGNRRVFDHPRAGILAFDYVKLSAMDDSGQKLFTCLPADPDTASKLPLLTA